MRGGDRDLPELELVALEDEEASPAVSTVDVKSKRWWPIALGAAVLAGAILVTGHGGGAQTASAPTTPSTSTTLFAPASGQDRGSAAIDAVRSSDPAVLVSSDATALIVLARGGSFEVDVTEPPNTISGFVARPPGTVVTLSNGLVRAYSRANPDGVDLGSARAVFPAQDPDRVWLTGVLNGNAAVKQMPIDGTVTPQLATGFIELPDGYDVVGVAGKQLVLSREQAQLATWEPGSRTVQPVSLHGSLLAAADGELAWTRPTCATCGIYVRRGDTIRVIKGVPNLDPTVRGAFSPDGRFLAVAITGAWPGGGTGAIVHSVAVIDLDGPQRVGASDVTTPDIRSTTPVAMTWSGGGALLVRDTSDRIVAYEPRAGGMASLFAFRPREQRPPTALTALPTRIPHTLPPSNQSPPTTLAPVPIPPG